jgi:hypothetical protein
MANSQYPEEEEEGLLGKALRSIGAPQQYLLEKTLEGISDEDVDRGSLDFGDVTEGLLGQQFMVDNPRTYAALSTAGDLLYDPLNFIPFAGIGKLGKSLMNMGRKISKGESPVNFGNIALGQEITRKDKAGQLHRLGDWYAGDKSKPNTISGSSAASKIKHITLGMIPDAFKNMAIRGVDSRSAYLFDEFGLDSNVVKELETLFKQKRALDSGGDFVVKNRNGRDLTIKDLSEKNLKKSGVQKRLAAEGSDAKVTAKDLYAGGTKGMVQNELLSQLEYVGSTLQKYFPDSKRHKQFMDGLKQNLFPETSFTDAAKLSAGDTTALSKIYPEIEPEILSGHIAPFITKEWGLKGDVVLNSKKFHEGMVNKLRRGSEYIHRGGKRYHSGTNLPGLKDSIVGPAKEALKSIKSGDFKGAVEGLRTKKGLVGKSSYDEMGRDLGINYIDAVADLAKGMTREVTSRGGKESYRVSKKVNKENLIKEATRRNKEYDRLNVPGKSVSSKAPVYFDIDGLRNAIKETADGTISVGTPALLGDRLLAHAALRLVLPKGGRQGFLVGFDQMKLGSIKALDAVVDRGSKYNFIAGDVTKITLDPAAKSGLLKVDSAIPTGPYQRVQNPTALKNPPKAAEAEMERIESVMQNAEGMLSQPVPKGYAAKRTAGLLAPYMQGAHVYDKLDEENKLELYKQFYEDNLSKPISGLLGL